MAPVPFDDPAQELRYREPDEVPTRERDRKIRHAMIWLRSELMAGPRPAGELEGLALAQGIPHTTLQHAKKRLYAHSVRRGNRYFWYLPLHKEQALAPEKGAHTS